ncbi:winged helix-turn-helix transcriptional regulator [Streptomyces sp. NPDC002159]
MAAVGNVTGPISSFDPYERGCPSRDLLDQIGSKWAVLVLGELGRNGASRFSRLRQALAGVSEKMLKPVYVGLPACGGRSAGRSAGHHALGAV